MKLSKHTHLFGVSDVLVAFITYDEHSARKAIISRPFKLFGQPLIFCFNPDTKLLKFYYRERYLPFQKMGKALDNTGYKGYLKPKRFVGEVQLKKRA